MSTSTWDREKALFLEALDQPDADRTAWVEQRTRDDAALRDAVLSLLAAHEPSDDFLEVPAAALSADAIPDVLPAAGRVGPYRLIKEIGRGGMGAVYLASRDDGEFEQHVAVKVVKRGMDTDLILDRFRHERQILAGLDHPNIARLLDGGTTDSGVPYFVMEYVPGVSVREYATTHALTLAQRLTLFRTICSAVEYAHRNLIVHRDLKSNNILVAPDGTPKLLDFGIAKLLNPAPDGVKTAETTIYALTPECASPEQLRGEAVTTATDVYSLGVLLYELLTNQRPFAAHATQFEELFRAVCEEDPPLPSTVAKSTDESHRRALRGDLDTIVMMAMHKDAARRYSSVAQLSEDIDRWQRGLPVRAQRDTFGYRASKFARRHRGALFAATVVMLSLVGGIAVSAWQAQVARVERARAERRFAEVRSLATSFLFDVHDAIRDLPGSTPARAMLLKRGLLSLDGLAKEAAGDTALMRDLAVAYQRVGEVQGNSYGANVGETDGALKSYERAVALLEQAGDPRAASTATQMAYIRAYEGLATMRNITGDLKDAAQYYSRALELLRPIAAANPDSTAYQETLANVLLELGDTQGGAGMSNLGDTKGAMASYGEAITLRETLLRTHPPTIEGRAGLANTLLNRGSLAWTLQDTSGAADLRRGVSMLEQIVAERPTDVLRKNWLLSGYARMRVPLNDAGRYAEAIVNDAKVVKMLQAIVAVDAKNTLFLRNLGVAHNNLGRDYRAAGQPALAVENHRRALAITEQLVRLDTTSIEHRRDRAFTEDVMAEALTDARDYRAALAMYDRAIASKKALQRAEPDNPWHADDLAYLHYGVGRALAQLKEWTRSETAFREAIPLAEAAVKRQDGAARARATLASIYGGASEMYAQQAALIANRDASGPVCTGAVSWHEKAEALWAALQREKALRASDVARRKAVNTAVTALSCAATRAPNHCCGD
ncbi:MAG: protein kinase [Gemmatimonadaceae bacterium]|nr:protein kinase [Gemmatimonadaceae bacterium]